MQGEVAGTFVGMLGAMLLAFGPRSVLEAEEVSIAGDMASLLAAVALVGYITVGGALHKTLRRPPLSCSPVQIHRLQGLVNNVSALTCELWATRQVLTRPCLFQAAVI